MLKFITGNKNKFKEISKALFPLNIKLVNINIEEIQELDPYKIIRHKLKEAFKQEKGNFFIEDTSTYYKALGNKLPGTLMKWFLDVLKPEGLYGLAKKLGSCDAEMRTVIAYAKNKSQVYFFEGRTKGKMVKPKGNGGFGLDPVFKPNSSSQTLAELKKSGLYKFSPRTKAALKFKAYLLK